MMMVNDDFEKKKLLDLMTYDYRGKTIPPLLNNSPVKYTPPSYSWLNFITDDPRHNSKYMSLGIKNRNAKEELKASRREAKLLAPKKWYQNSRRRMLFIPERSRNAALPPTLSSIDRNSGPGKMLNPHHLSSSSQSRMLPRMYSLHGGSMIHVGGWNTPPVLDKVLQVFTTFSFPNVGVSNFASFSSS